jgi:hypothetical protein
MSAKVGLLKSSRQRITSPGPGSGETPAGGTAVTVSDAVPLAPPLVAVMLVLPTARVVTRPEPETVATAVLLDDHVMARPVKTFPFASRVTADSCTVKPTCTLGEAGDTVTDATGAGGGAATVSAAEPLCPSLVATMLAEPALRAVTTPLPLTEAIPALELDQEIVRPVSVFPLASRSVAVALVA